MIFRFSFTFLILLLQRFHDDELLTDESVADMRSHLNSFQHAWIEAHDLSYITDPAPYTNLIQTAITVFVFTVPMAFVDYFQRWTFIPFTAILHTFLGLNTLATHMRNPFGEDPHDIKLDVKLRDFIKYVDEIKIASKQKDIVLHLPAMRAPAWLISMNEAEVVELLKEKLALKTDAEVKHLENGVHEHRIHGSALMQVTKFLPFTRHHLC